VDDVQTVVSVSRRIAAPAPAVFELLTTPGRHLEMDGSGMLRGTDSDRVSAVGEVFVMRMYFKPLGGDYTMNNHVVEFEPDRLIAWEPENGVGHPEVDSPNARWGHRWRFELEPDGPTTTVVTETWDGTGVPPEEAEDGRQWIPSMTRTLERLDELLAGNADHADAPEPH
jgi:uncharacterized protein YndB with AHSA1/START domain